MKSDQLLRAILPDVLILGQRIFPVGVTIFKNKELPVYT